MDDKKYTIYDKVDLAFQKLHPESGDFIIIKFPSDIHPKQLELFATSIQDLVPPNVTIMCSRDGVEINKLSEKQLNDAGWYKFENTTPQ